MPASSRGPEPQRSSSAPVQVLSVPPQGPIVVRFLDQYKGLETHRKGGQTIPCPGVPDCPSALHRAGIIWKGYAPVESWEGGNRVWRPWVLEITEALEELLRNRELRGETWSLFRMAKEGRKGTVSGVYCETVPEAKLSPSFEVLPVLLRLFHCSTLRLGAINPLPPKVVLAPVSGDAPRLPAELQPDKPASQDPEAMRKLKDLMAELRGTTRPPAPSNGDTHASNGK